ncbi:hypothetical protein ACMGD3_24655 [Lysinibacillus sphaericus]
MEKLIFELGSGLVDVCVVAIVHKEDAYGYSLTPQVLSCNRYYKTTLHSL